jgi:hypothetical protein
MKTSFLGYILSTFLRPRSRKETSGAFLVNRLALLIRALVLAGVLIFAGLPLFSQQAVTEEDRARAMDAIEVKYDALRGLPSPERNRQTAAFMRTLKGIAAAGVSDDGNVWALFSDRVPYQIFANDQPLPSPSGSIRTTKPPARPVIVPGGNQETVRFAPIQLVTATAFPRGDDGPEEDSYYSSGPWASLSSRASGAQAQLQANDLPVSTEAQVANALGHAYVDRTGIIRDLLAANGYKCAPGNDASVEALMKIGDRKPGVFFLEAHGGQCEIYDTVTNANVRVYTLMSSTPWSREQTLEYARQNLFFKGYLGVGSAIADRDPMDENHFIHKRGYTITMLFVRTYWRFSENSFVFIHGCTSISMKETMRDVGASIFGGYDSLVNSSSLDSVMFLFDRLLGQNIAPPDEALAPQRPFDYQDIAVDMERKGLNPNPNNPGCKMVFGLGRGNFGLLNPSLKYARIIPYESRVELIGLFGADPGEKNRKVDIENIAIPVESWEPEKIVCHLPDAENGSCGEIKVSHRGRVSNSRWLTQWKGTAEFREYERENLHFNADFVLRFVADPWPYREHAGDKPVPNRVWGVSSMSGSKCSWAASGQVLASGGRVAVQWTGQGTPSVVTDDLLTPLDGTFEAGGPVTDLLGKELWVSFAISDFFIESPFAKGDPRQGKRPTRLHAYDNGQSAVKFRVNADFDFSSGHCPAADDRDDAGGNAAWSEMKATHSMPKNARR